MAIEIPDELKSGEPVAVSGFPQFDRAWDFSCHISERRFYAICSTPRSGSHYLAHLMYSTGAMGYPLEYFHPDHFRRWTMLSGQTHVQDVTRYLQSRRTSPNGYFGFKAHFPEFVRVFSEYALDSIFPQCRFILIEREDTLGQAISLVRARQTNQWISMHQSRGETRYSCDAIESAILEVLEQRASWSRFFTLTGRGHLRITYESLVANPDKTLGKIASYLETGSFQRKTGGLAPDKQAGAETLSWRGRFLSEAAKCPFSYAATPLRLLIP